MLIKKNTNSNSKYPRRFFFFAILAFTIILFSLFSALINSASAVETTPPKGVPSGSTYVGEYTGNNLKHYKIYTAPDGKYYEYDASGILGTVTEISKEDYQKATAKVNEQNKPGFFTNTVLEGLKQFLMWLAGGVLWLFSWFVWLGAKLLEMSITAPTEYFGGFIKAAIVQTGWTIVRDLANMFFSLILLVIAFATILRIETYGMKQVLWKLVVAALLINFSLVIAGVVIDFSNVLTNFFVKNATYNITTDGVTTPTSDISAAILSGLKVHTLYNINVSSDSSTTGSTSDTPSKQIQGEIGFTTIFLNIILGIIFMLITAFVLFAAAVLFLIRMVALWILLIFAPLAWLAMILPATRSFWNKWWSEFMKWIIFAPVYGFFIYLTVSMISSDILSKTASDKLVASGLPISEFTSDLRLIANYIVLTIFMVAGLIFARSSGITGATAMAKLGTNLRNAGGRMTSRWAAKGGKIPGMSWAAQKLGVTGKLDQWQKEGTGFQKGLANVIRGAGKVKATAFTAASPQVWSRYWAYRQQRANAESFDKGAGRLDAFATGFTGVIRNYRSASGAKQEQLAKEEAQKIYEARMRGDQTYENRDISGPTIDRMLLGRGIQPGTPEAEEFMRQYDWEQAQDIAKDKIVAGGAVAGMGAAFEGMFGKGRLEQIAESREVSRRQQEFGQTLRDEDQIVDYYLKAKDPVDREALFRLVASINGLNTLFARMRTDFNPKNLSQYMQQNFRGGRAEVLAADVSAMAAQTGNFSFVGTTAWDASKGRIAFADPKTQTATAVRKSLEMEAQTWARMTHPDSWINRDANGRQTEISDFSKEMLNQITGAHIKQIDRFQGRTLTSLYNFRNEFRNYINTSLSGQQQQIANSFIAAVENRYTRAT